MFVFVFDYYKSILSTTGKGFKNARVLRSFKEPEILLVMRRGLKMVYVRNVGRLPVLKIPVGLGRLVFMRVDKHMNAKLSGLFVDLCVEALVMI